MQIKKLFLSFLAIFAILITAGCGSAPTITSTNSNAGEQQSNDQLADPDCGEAALLSYSCRTSRFPADINGKGDVACSFLISCCGRNIKNGWETVYPEIAGLRGFVDSGAIESTASCKDSVATGDLDGDGTLNESDTTPLGGDKSLWEQKAAENSGR
jgi:hypothetical protein